MDYMINVDIVNGKMEVKLVDVKAAVEKSFATVPNIEHDIYQDNIGNIIRVYDTGECETVTCMADDDDDFSKTLVLRLIAQI
jgi:hypothetical protein